MDVIVKVGVPFLILMVLLAAAQVQPTYFEIGGKLVLRPGSGFTNPITSITWKHNGNLVAEWIQDRVPLEYLGDLKGRSEVNLATGILTVKNMQKSEDGLFTVEINNQVLPGSFNAVGLKNLNQSNVEVILRPLTCDSKATNCTLDCDGVFINAEPVQYFWKTGEAGEWVKGVKKKTITNDEETRGAEIFTCKAENPISSKTSEPLKNPFNNQPAGLSAGGVAGIIIAILLAGLAIAGMIWYWFYKKHPGFQRASTDSNGSPGQPAGDGKTPETTEMFPKALPSPSSS